MPSSAKRSRNYVFTLNNYTEDEVSAIQSIDAAFIGYGKEVGESGTPHLQGMCSFRFAKSFVAAKAAFPTRTHLEVMRGTSEEAWNYCSKDGDVWSIGERPRSSNEVADLNRCRYKEFIEHAKSGNDDDVDPCLYVQYYSTFHKIKAANQRLPDSLSTVCGIWIHGLPGTGKSHAVNAAHPEAYRKQCNKWWDGYVNQETVWLDDIDPDSSAWIARYLKIWADKWSFSAEVKGGVICIRPKRIIITSNYTIDQMGFRLEDLAAIKRRFTEVEKVASQNIIL